MRIVIDSISDDIARVEFDSVIAEIPAALLPEGAKEGDVLAFVILNSSQILSDAQSRIDRMKKMSAVCSAETIEL